MLNNLFSLARIASAKGFSGPSLGPKLATETPRSFSDQTLREAANAPRLLGGVGFGDMSAVDTARATSQFASQNVVLQGLTLDAHRKPHPIASRSVGMRTSVSWEDMR